jgi:hypothetical protein
VRKVSEKFVCVIVRRPHAYQFRTKFRGKDVPIPGMLVLDADENLLGGFDIEPAKELAAKLNALTK